MLVLPADFVVPAAGCGGCFARASSVNVDDDVKTTVSAVVGQMAARQMKPLSLPGFGRAIRP
jgi:hypothetical protein